MYSFSDQLILGDNAYVLAVNIFNTGDYHVEVDGELTELYADDKNLDDIIDVAWKEVIKLAHEKAQNLAFASELDDEEGK